MDKKKTDIEQFKTPEDPFLTGEIMVGGKHFSQDGKQWPGIILLSKALVSDDRGYVGKIQVDVRMQLTIEQAKKLAGNLLTMVAKVDN